MRRISFYGYCHNKSIIIFVIVLALTIFTINKGYAYKHTIDEHPDKMDKKQKTHPPE
ncbi:YtzI protein [Psychrobacillus sp. MER TA 171]|uniref:YtzI protein n=1 Tax=Psychrobacillus sp. MER TA 171 TaxID=2939577 RepID=UPI00334017F7